VWVRIPPVLPDLNMARWRKSRRTALKQQRLTNSVRVQDPSWLPNNNRVEYDAYLINTYPVVRAFFDPGIVYVTVKQLAVLAVLKIACCGFESHL
jgi:hypothetical protein